MTTSTIPISAVDGKLINTVVVILSIPMSVELKGQFTQVQPDV